MTEKEMDELKNLKGIDIETGGEDGDLWVKKGNSSEDPDMDKHFKIFNNKPEAQEGGYLFINPTTHRTELKKEVSGNDAEARAEIAKAKGTTNYNDETPISLSNVKTALDGMKIKDAVNGKNTTVSIENGVLKVDATGSGEGTVKSVNKKLPDAQGEVSLVKLDIGLGNVPDTDFTKPVSDLQTDVTGIKKDFVKTVNLKVVDAQNNVTLKASDIKTNRDITLEQEVSDLNTYTSNLSRDKENSVNKTNTIQEISLHPVLMVKDNAVLFPTVAAVIAFVNTKIAQTITTVHEWVTEALKAYYTKGEIDIALGKKAEKDASYTKVEEDALLIKKADADKVPTTEQMNTELAKKVDKSTLKTDVESIVCTMSLDAKSIQGKKVNLAGIKDGQGIGYNQATDTFIPVNLGGGSSEFVWYSAKKKMKYGENIKFNTKDIANLKMGNFMIYTQEEEVSDTSQYCTSIGGNSCEPSTAMYTWTYDYMEGSDVIKEVRITKLTGRTDIATEVLIFLLVYTGKANDIPFSAGADMLPKGVHPVAHVKGVASIIDEHSVHEWTNLVRTGDDLELLMLPYIDSSWRKLTPMPTVTLQNGRVVPFIIQPRFVKGFPTITGTYTNCSGKGAQPEQPFKVRVSISCASKDNKNPLTTLVTKDFDAVINWSGIKDTVGSFSVDWTDMIDCRDYSVLNIQVSVVFPNANDTIDAVSLKCVWTHPIIEREND